MLHSYVTGMTGVGIGPVLLLYVNELPELTNSNLKMFADNVKLF